jgi:hypothetical protein
MTTVNTKWISNGAITDVKLAASAKQSVLESKLVAGRNGVLTFNATGADDVVTTPVLAVATTDVAVANTTTLGIYTGTISGASDWKKVLIRAAGTDNGISDGLGDEIYGVITEATGVYTLTYYKSSGAAFTFGAATDVDFFFVEIFNEYNKPVHVGLVPVAGVVDATAANALTAHIDDTVGAHNDTAIAYTRDDGSKINIASASDDVGTAINNLDDAIGALASTPTNYTPASPSVVASHLAAIDAALATAGSDEFSTATLRINDATTPTKQIAFDAASIASSTVRTITMPDRNVNLGNVTQEITEALTLSAGNITAKYKDLANVPKTATAVKVCPKGGIPQVYTTDFTVITDGSVIKRLNWDALAMDGILEENDILIVSYLIAG